MVYVVLIYLDIKCSLTPAKTALNFKGTHSTSNNDNVANKERENGARLFREKKQRKERAPLISRNEIVGLALPALHTTIFPHHTLHAGIEAPNKPPQSYPKVITK